MWVLLGIDGASPFSHIYIGTAVYLQAFPSFLSTIRSKEFQGQMHYIYVPMASDYS